MIPWHAIGRRTALLGAAICAAFFLFIGMALTGAEMAAVILAFTAAVEVGIWLMVKPRERRHYREPRQQADPFSGPTTVTR